MKHKSTLMAVACLAAGFVDGADILSSAKYVWFFDTDVNGNGILDVDDVRDVRDWGSVVPGSYDGIGKPASVSRSTEDFDLGDTAWLTEDVVSPAQGTVDALRCLDMVCVTNGTRKTKAQSFCLKSGSAWSGSMTAIARVNVSSFNGTVVVPELHNTVRSSMLINNGFKGNKDRGLAFGFTNPSYDPRKGHLHVLGRGMKHAAEDILMHTNVWYDVAWSISDNGDGTARGVFVVVSSDDGVRTATAEFNDVFGDSGLDRTDIVVGAIYTTALGPTDAQRFSGKLSRLAIWDRALTEDEILEVIMKPRPWFEVGIENGSGGEFGLEGESAYRYEIGKAPVHTMPRSLTESNPTLTLVAPGYENMNEFKVPYMFSVKAADGFSGTADIELKIEGKKVGSTQTVSAGGLAKWYVDAGVCTVPDPEISLSKTGGSASELVFDRISMTGSFMIGTNDWNTTEFGSASSETVYVGMRDSTLIGKGPSDSFPVRYFRFFMTPEEARRHTYTYSSRVYEFGSGNTASSKIESAGYTSKQYPFEILLNDEIIYASPKEGLPNGREFSAEIPHGLIKAGWNEFRFRLPDDLYAAIDGTRYWWTGFDYHKLSMSRERRGAVIVVR